jgi:hypothetical protein
MIVNFVRGSGNYSNADQIDIMPSTNDLFVEELDPIIVVENHAGKASLLCWLFALAIFAQVLHHY